MSAIGALCEGLSDLLKTDGPPLHITALCVVAEESAGQALLVCANGLGVAAYRASPDAFPVVARPSSSSVANPVNLDLETDPDGFLERRLLLTGLGDDLRRNCGVRRALA